MDCATVLTPAGVSPPSPGDQPAGWRLPGGTECAMATKALNRSSSADQARGAPALGRQVRVSDSGQFTVSMDAVRELPSFQRDVRSVAQIREKLQQKR